MAARSDENRAGGLDIVRHQLMLGLHLGQLQPGARAPSVRRLAERVGLNLKTVHRAYTHLADEGLLDVRPGSGTFIASRLPGDGATGDIPIEALMSVARRVRASARSCGVPPTVLAGFVQRLLCGGLEGLPLAVTECNDEQQGLLARELTHGMGARPVALPLSTLERRGAAAARGLFGVVTTECHRSEVVDALAGTPLPVYALAFDACFPSRIVHAAESGPVVLVVRDARFGAVLRALLARLGADSEALARVEVLEPAEAERTLEQPRMNRAVVALSPLISDRFALRLIGKQRSLGPYWQIDREAFDRVHTAIAYDLAAREAARAERACR